MTRTLFVVLCSGLLLLPATVALPDLNQSLIDANIELEIEGKARVQKPAPRRTHIQAGPDLPIDFNGDGRGDTAVGAYLYDLPLNNGDLIANAGAVSVIYGAKSGKATTKKNQFLTIEGFNLTPQTNDQFGISLAAGNLNGDEFSDLVVGMNGYSSAQYGTRLGGLVVYIGTKKGLKPSSYFSGTDPGGFLGTSVATGDFDGDGLDEVAAGAVGGTVNGKTAAGWIGVYRGVIGNNLFVTLQEQQRFHADSPGVKGKAKQNTFFGQRLYTADWNGDRYYDLGVGGPVFRGAKGDSWFFFGSPNGINPSDNQRVKIKGGQKGDAFGFSFGAIFRNDDENADPLIGAPGRNFIAGLYGSRSGITLQGSYSFGNPLAKKDDNWGYSISSAPRSFLVGAPGTDLDDGFQVYENSGAVDYIQAINLNFRRYDTFQKFDNSLTGFSTGLTRSSPNVWTGYIGAPGLNSGSGAVTAFFPGNHYEADFFARQLERRTSTRRRVRKSDLERWFTL